MLLALAKVAPQWLDWIFAWIPPWTGGVLMGTAIFGAAPVAALCSKYECGKLPLGLGLAIIAAIMILLASVH